MPYDTKRKVIEGTMKKDDKWHACLGLLMIVHKLYCRRSQKE